MLETNIEIFGSMKTKYVFDVLEGNFDRVTRFRKQTIDFDNW